MFSLLHTLDQFNQLLRLEPALLVYFSTDECQVCKVLKPKVEGMIAKNFPKIKLFYVNINQSPEVAAQNRVFAAPTILVFFNKQEFLRKSRNFGLDELKLEISRPYRIMFP